MFSRVRVVAGSLFFSALTFSALSSALEFPLPPPGEGVVGEVRIVKAQYEDTFADIGTANDLGYSEMVAANPGVDPWLPGAGTEVILPTRFILPPGPREGVVINLAEYRLYYYPKGKDLVYTYPLGVGREGWGSPLGETQITGKIENPAWYPPASIRKEHAEAGDPLPAVVPPGPDNPLGPVKMTLGFKGYLIHGSNRKFGIGMQVSHGCFRMFNDNAVEFAKMIPVGTKVRIIDEPYKFGTSAGRVYLEAHSPLREDDKVGSVVDKHAALVNKLLKADLPVQLRLDWGLVREVVAAEDGLPVDVTGPDAGLATNDPTQKF